MNRKMTFTYPLHSGGKVVMEISAESDLTEAIQAFEQFLRGSGYYFDGTLDIVDQEE